MKGRLALGEHVGGADAVKIRSVRPMVADAARHEAARVRHQRDQRDLAQ